jgi:hypothetical protein
MGRHSYLKRLPIGIERADVFLSPQVTHEQSTLESRFAKIAVVEICFLLSKIAKTYSTPAIFQL